MSTKNEGKPKKRSKKREGLSEVMKKTRKGMLKLKGGFDKKDKRAKKRKKKLKKEKKETAQPLTEDRAQALLFKSIGEDNLKKMMANSSVPSAKEFMYEREKMGGWEDKDKKKGRRQASRWHSMTGRGLPQKLHQQCSNMLQKAMEVVNTNLHETWRHAPKIIKSQVPEWFKKVAEWGHHSSIPELCVDAVATQDVEMVLKTTDEEVGEGGEEDDAKNVVVEIGKVHHTRNSHVFGGSVGTFSDLHIAKSNTKGGVKRGFSEERC
eukprot:jgi/Bigna1/90872/estExt_fgenesh1_pg.C_810091